MLEVDGFTLIDYIKSSIEILMNMKIEENEQNLQEESGYFKFQSKKKKRRDNQKKDGDDSRHIPKIDDKTPTSSILDLQKKLDQVSSPTSSSSSYVSIPVAHKEYEKALRALESECRNHIKVEQ